MCLCDEVGMGGSHHLSILANVLVFIRSEISPAKTLNMMHTIHLRWSAIVPSLFTLIWMLIWNKTPQRELLAKAYHSGNPMVTKGGAAFSQHFTTRGLTENYLNDQFNRNLKNFLPPPPSPLQPKTLKSTKCSRPIISRSLFLHVFTKDHSPPDRTR